MAGNLTASDMSSLFSPVPFGESRTTLWEQAAAPEHAVLWDLFRSLDMDRQSRVLHKWEAHVRELQAGPAAIQNPAVHAIAAWAAVSGRARQAMKRSSPAHVQAIETQILLFLQQVGGCNSSCFPLQQLALRRSSCLALLAELRSWEGHFSRYLLPFSSLPHCCCYPPPHVPLLLQDDPEEELVLEGLEDGFHRLIAHGLAEYHSLNSHSRVVEGGSGGEKEVVVRRRPAAAAASGSSAMAAATAAMAAAAIEEGEGAAGAAAGQQQQQAMSPQQAHQQQAAAPAVLAISCCDILHILVDEPQPLNPAVLHQAYLHPIDSSSEAGDHHTAAQRQEQLQQMLVEAA